MYKTKKEENKIFCRPLLSRNRKIIFTVQTLSEIGANSTKLHDDNFNNTWSKRIFEVHPI